MPSPRASPVAIVAVVTPAGAVPRAAPTSRPLPTPTARGGPTTFVGAWPYSLPPAGHFNVYAPGALTLGIYHDLWQLPLAKYLWATDTYVPFLAASWGFEPPDRFTLQLRPGLTWDDGTPLSSRDVWATLWCWRVVGHPLWDFVDQVTTPDDSSVFLRLKSPTTLVQYLALEINVTPAADYNPYAVRAAALFQSGKALTSPEGQTLARDLASFRPRTARASGPYAIARDGITATHLDLLKASRATNGASAPFDRIVLDNGDVLTITPPTMAKLVDYVSQDLAPDTLKNLANERVRLQPASTYSGDALGINYGNDRVLSVLGDKRARQAVALALNGDEVGQAASGVAGTGVRSYVGFGELLVPRWLSREQIGQLIAYPHSPNRAEATFQALSWTRDSGGTWVAGDGSRAEFDLLVPNDATSQTVAGLVARQLSAVGIKLTPRSVSPDERDRAVLAGSFDLALLPWGARQPHPYHAFVADLFRYNPTATGVKGSPGMSFPLTQTTDAAGSVDLAALVRGTALGFDVSAQKDAVARVARAFNELLPIIPIEERWTRSPLLDGTRVTGWLPPDNPIYQNDPLADSFVVLQLLDGTLRPV